MKLFCMALGIALPLVLSQPAFSSPDEQAAAAGTPQVIVLRAVGGAGDEQHDVVMQVNTEVATDGGEVIVHGNVEGAADHVFVSVATPADPNRGWLGVQHGQVPAALAKHLPTGGGAGVMVGNVVKGSPADQAGLEQYDVITAVNGQSVTGDVGKLAELIGGLAPGAKATIKVLREGAESTLNAALSSRPSGEEIEWKYEFSPEAEIHESFKTRGKILHRGPDGKMVLEELGELEALKNLPDDIRQMIPRMDQFTTKIFADDDNRSFSTSVSRDGETLSVKQDSGGPIEVERTDKDGNITKATYADAAALEAADADAYEVYQDTQSDVVIETHPGATKHLRFFAPGGAMNLQGHEAWREQIEKAMREAREAMKGAQKTAADARKHFQFRFQNAPGHPFLSWTDQDGTNLFGPPAGRSFRVNPDGQIEVIIRKGENEVTKVFKDEADMAARDPELHEAYSETQIEDEE